MPDLWDEGKAAASRHGITGVPFFVIDGKYGLSGAHGAGNVPAGAGKSPHREG
jgi:hypothetical protein